MKCTSQTQQNACILVGFFIWTASARLPQRKFLFIKVRVKKAKNLRLAFDNLKNSHFKVPTTCKV